MPADESSEKKTANGIYEIRDYTIDPAWFDRYVEWARNDAAPRLALHGLMAANAAHQFTHRDDIVSR